MPRLRRQPGDAARRSTVLCLPGGDAVIPPSPGWRLNHQGDALRRRYGPVCLRLFRKRDRGGYFLTVELRLDATDPAEAAAL